MRRTIAVAFIFFSFTRVLPAQTPAGSPDIAALKAQLDALKADYEKRIADLEKQLQDVQTQMLQMPTAETALIPTPAAAPPAPTTTFGALNPAITAIGNFVGRGDNQKVFNFERGRIDNTLSLREAELDFRVPIDPYADGVFIPAFESDEPGKFEVDVEEAYINLKKLPFAGTPLGLKFQIGRFRPAFGKFNLLHTHDLPWTMRPLPTQEFLGDDGFISQGFSSDFFLPTPWDENQSLNARFQVLTAGDVRVQPLPHGRLSCLGNLRWFKTIGSHNTELGWSTYWHPSQQADNKVALNALDFMYRWKPFRQGEWRSFLLGGEMMFSNAQHPDAEEPADVALNLTEINPSNRKPYGGSVFTQWQFDRRKYAGVRWDYTTTIVDPSLIRRSFTPNFTYYFSEFLRMRLSYEHRWSSILAENKRNSFFAELNWVFGSHPPEPFWVNK